MYSLSHQGFIRVHDYDHYLLRQLCGCAKDTLVMHIKYDLHRFIAEMLSGM